MLHFPSSFEVSKPSLAGISRCVQEISSTPGRPSLHSNNLISCCLCSAPGRAAFTASGSTPLIVLHGGTMKRRCPLLQFHRCPPVDSLRVHWGPVFPSSQRRGACTMGPHPPVHGFPVLRLLCPIRLFLRTLAFRWGLPCLLPTRLDIPQEVSRVQPGRLKRNDGGGVFLSLPHPLFAAPQSLDRGENRLTSATVATVSVCIGPYSQRSLLISGSTG